MTLIIQWLVFYMAAFYKRLVAYNTDHMNLLLDVILRELHILRNFVVIIIDFI